jgi:hypothetical protein
VSLAAGNSGVTAAVALVLPALSYNDLQTATERLEVEQMKTERFRQRSEAKGEKFRFAPLARRKIWELVVAGLVVSLALLAAGCGGGGSSEADSGSASAASGSSSGSDANDQLAEWSQCIRENGVPSFPDQRTVNGQIQLSLPPDVDASSPQFQSALQACQSLSPVQQNGGGAPSAEQQNQILKFVKCMRKNGVPDFPDPTTGGGVIVGSGIDPSSPQFQSAMQACQSLRPAGATTTG